MQDRPPMLGRLIQGLDLFFLGENFCGLKSLSFNYHSSGLGVLTIPGLHSSNPFCWGCFFISLVTEIFSASLPSCSYRQLLCSVQSLSHVLLFTPPWTTTSQASLSITNSWSLLKLMSMESVMPAKHLIRCRPLLLPSSIFPSIRVFSTESVLTSGGQSIQVSVAL